MYYIRQWLDFVVLPSIKYAEASPLSNDHGELIGVAVAPLDHTLSSIIYFWRCTAVQFSQFVCIRCAQKRRRPYVPPNLILMHYIAHEDHVDVGWTSLGGVEDELSRLLVRADCLWLRLLKK